MKFVSIAAVAAFAAMSVSPAFAATKTTVAMTGAMHAMGGMMKTCAPPPRFGGSNYCSSPKLTNTLALIEAGGGPAKFSTVTLFGVLAGPVAGPESKKLTAQYTAAGFALYVKTFDFVINDSLKIVTAAKVALPKAPVPAPADGSTYGTTGVDGKALALALYLDGVSPTKGFSVEYMLDHLVTHGIHVQVMKDIDANPELGPKADAAYHVVTLQIFKDLKGAYKL